MSKAKLDVTGIELRHLRYFLAVADECHFSRAAERLGIAQPPLSQQIRRLELLVGEVLFERRPSVRLTPAGEVLAEAAERLLSQLSSDVDRARRTGAGFAGSLTIGFPASALVTWFPSLVRSFRDRYPEIELKLRELSSAAQIAELRGGTIDIGLIRGAISDRDLHIETMLDEPFLAVVPDRHPLSRRRVIGLKELATEGLVFFPRAVAPSLHDEVIALFRDQDLAPTIVMEAQEWLTIIGLVETGVGVSIAPASFRRLRWGNVHYISLRDVSAVTRIAVVSPLRGAIPAADRFIAMMRDHPRD